MCGPRRASARRRGRRRRWRGRPCARRRRAGIVGHDLEQVLVAPLHRVVRRVARRSRVPDGDSASISPTSCRIWSGNPPRHGVRTTRWSGARGPARRSCPTIPGSPTLRKVVRAFVKTTTAAIFELGGPPGPATFGRLGSPAWLAPGSASIAQPADVLGGALDKTTHATSRTLHACCASAFTSHFVFWQDVPGFLVGSKVDGAPASSRHVAKMLYAVAQGRRTLKSPCCCARRTRRILRHVRAAYEPDLIVAWPTAENQRDGTGRRTNIIFRKEIRAGRIRRDGTPGGGIPQAHRSLIARPAPP